jgi:hypothetical protein
MPKELFPREWIEKAVGTSKPRGFYCNCRSYQRCSQQVINLSYSIEEKIRLIDIANSAMLPEDY